VADPPADNTTLVGFNDKPSPAGDDEAERDRLPAKPFRLERVTEDVEDDPAGMVRLVGLTEMLKSGPAGCVTWTLCDTEAVAPAESRTASWALYVPLIE